MISSLKTLLENQVKFAHEEKDNLELARQRLAQLNAGGGNATFKYAEERNRLQNKLSKIIYELNAKDMLHDDRKIESKPHLRDYLDLGVEVIDDKIETQTAEDEEQEDPEAMEKSA